MINLTGLNQVNTKLSTTSKKSNENQNVSNKADNNVLSLPTVNNLKAKYLAFGSNDHENKPAGTEMKTREYEVIDDTGVRFKDVGGIEHIKEKAQEIVDYIKNPASFKTVGADVPKGILLYGPPGSGKTLMAKAIAGEAGVPFIPVCGSDFDNGLKGGGSTNMNVLFETMTKAIKEKAIKLEKYKADNPLDEKPSKVGIIFIDEFDTIAQKRTSGGGDHRETLNKLLAEMDGINEHKGVNIIVLAATNTIDDIDPAAKRDGRFDNVLEVPNPASNIDARRDILKIHSENKHFKNEEEKKDFLERAAIMTEDFSGAQLKGLLNRAAKYTIKRPKEDRFINWDDIVEARIETKAGPKVKIDNPIEHKLSTVAHECAHALISQAFHNITDDPIRLPRQNSFIALEERGQFYGAVFNTQGKNYTITFDSSIANAALFYAGYVIEKENNNGVNTAGVYQDLENATKLITHAVTKLGMGPNTGPNSVAANKFAEKAAGENVSKDINLMKDTAYDISKLMVDFHKGFIDEYVEDFKKARMDKDSDASEDFNDGRLMTGETFAKRLDKWLDETGKRSELPKLQKQIKEKMDMARQGSKPVSRDPGDIRIN